MSTEVEREGFNSLDDSATASIDLSLCNWTVSMYNLLKHTDIEYRDISRFLARNPIRHSVNT